MGEVQHQEGGPGTVHLLDEEGQGGGPSYWPNMAVSVMIYKFSLFRK